MSLNALIAQGPRPIQIEDPVNQLAKVMQIQAGQRQAQLGEMQMEEYGEKRERARGLRDLLKQNYDTPDARESALMRGGYVEEATKLGTDRRANLKADTENSAATFKLANDRYSTFQKTMGALKDDPNLSKQLLMQVGQNLVQQGIIPASMYQGAVADMPDDPALLRQRLTQGLATQLPPEKVFELFAPKAEKIDNGASISFRDTNPNSPTFGQQTGGAPIQKQQSPDSVASVAATLRGQNMTDQRSREQIANSLTKPFEVTGQDGNPVLVQQDKQGNIRPVQGYLPKQGASKPLTEGQAKANLFGTRMRESDKILNALEDEGVRDSGVIKSTVQGAAGLVPFIGDKLSDAADSVMNVVPGALGGPNGKQQQVSQARRDFINAVLRKESGAVITSQEFANADRQYFPQPGEPAEVVAQKRNARRLATELMLAEVPGGPRGGSSGNGKAPPGKAASGSVLDAADAILNGGK